MQATRLTAIGGVLLAAAITMTEVRLGNAWANGVHFAVAGVGFLFLLGLALMGGKPEDGKPTPEQSALFIAALVVLVSADIRFGQVTNKHAGDHPGSIMWMAFLYAAIAAFLAVRRGSAFCAFAAAVATGIGIVELIDKIDSGPFQNTGLRWVFFGLIVLYALVALALWRRRPRYSAQLVNTSMFAVLGILGTVGFGILFGDAGDDLPHLSTWWELVVLAAPLVAIAFAILARERGPGWTAGVTLAIAITVIGAPGDLADTGQTLMGWPLVLLIAAALALVMGFAMPRRT
jgi:hypothetical protein